MGAIEYLYDFIISCVPDVEGYGNYNKTYDEDGVSDHSIFKQSIREDHPGDIGVFITSSASTSKMCGDSLYIADVQIVLNTINGDIISGLAVLNDTFKNIRSTKGNENILLKSIKLLNIHPVGKNSSGLQWCTCNIETKYIINEE